MSSVVPDGSGAWKIVPAPVGNWNQVSGKPYVTVTPNGPTDGGDYGPNTSGTTTTGWAEALKYLKTNGGGRMYIKRGHAYGGTGLSFDGTVPICIEGELSSGYAPANNGIIYNYTGSGWALDSTSTAYGPLDGDDVLITLKNITIQCSGASYNGGINSTYLQYRMEGRVNVFGNTVAPVANSYGVYLYPNLNQFPIVMEDLWIEGFDENLRTYQDLVKIGHLSSGYFGTYGIYKGSGIQATIGTADIFNNINVGAAALAVNGGMLIEVAHIGLITNAHLFVNLDNTVGANATRVLQSNFSNNSALLGTAGMGYDGLTSNYLYSPFDDYPLGFSYTQPAVPAGTGSANSVQNVIPRSVRIYQKESTITSLGTHVIDIQGNDEALPEDPLELTLGPAEKVYYATAAPASWLWKQV